MVDTSIAPPPKGKIAPLPAPPDSGAPDAPPPAPGAAPDPSAGGAPAAPGGQPTTLGGAAIASELALPGELAQISKEHEARQAKLQEDFQKGLMNPPKYDPPPPPEAKAPQDPLKVWGSTAMMLAAVGSLFTRTPLTTAMNAAAGVVDAYRKGDQDMANYEFTKWKIANDNYQNAFKYQQDYYKMAMGEISHEEDIEQKFTEDEKADLKAGVDAIAHAFNDEVMLQQKSFDDQMKLWMYRDRTQMQNVKYAEELEKYHAMANLAASPEFQQLMRDHPEQALAEITGKLGQTEQGNMQIHRLLDNNVISKQHDIATTAHEDLIQQLRVPGIEHNAAAQIGIIDRWAYLETGSTRPSVAQYKNIIEHMGYKDWAHVMVELLKGNSALIGPQQIANIKAAADAEYAGRQASYIRYLMRPGIREKADAIGYLPDKSDIDKLQQLYRDQPQNINRYLYSFNQRYGAKFQNNSIGQDILGITHVAPGADSDNGDPNYGADAAYQDGGMSAAKGNMTEKELREAAGG